MRACEDVHWRTGLAGLHHGPSHGRSPDRCGNHSEQAPPCVLCCMGALARPRSSLPPHRISFRFGRCCCCRCNLPPTRPACSRCCCCCCCHRIGLEVQTDGVPCRTRNGQIGTAMGRRRRRRCSYPYPPPICVGRTPGSPVSLSRPFFFFWLLIIESKVCVCTVLYCTAQCNS